MIRKATHSDIPAIISLAIESVEIDPLPVDIDPVAMSLSAKKCMGNGGFAYVSEIDGVVVAAVGAQSYPSFWHTRSDCSVLLYYTRVPGEGMKLIREFARWVKGRRRVRTATIELEPNADPRIFRFLERLGFNRPSTNMTYVREKPSV